MASPLDFHEVYVVLVRLCLGCRGVESKDAPYEFDVEALYVKRSKTDLALRSCKKAEEPPIHRGSKERDHFMYSGHICPCLISKRIHVRLPVLRGGTEAVSIGGY